MPVKKKENRTKILQVWLTPSEHDRLYRNADIVDKPVARAVRAALLQWNHNVEEQQKIVAEQAMEEMYNE